MTNINDQQHKPLVFTGDRDAFLQRAIAAEDGCVSVGGLAHELGMLRAPEELAARDIGQDRASAFDPPVRSPGAHSHRYRAT